MKELEYFINLTIADSSIRIFNESDFQSYESFAHYIKQNLISGNVVVILRFIDPIVDEINYIYGFDIEESSNKVVRYFRLGLWSTYHNPARMARNHFGKFLAE